MRLDMTLGMLRVYEHGAEHGAGHEAGAGHRAE